MIDKSECWANIIGSIGLVIISYLIIYKSPNFESLKIIIPLLNVFAGWVLYDNFNKLDKIK